MDVSDGGAWSPYLVGALIGILSMATFYFSNQPLGASTSFARIAGLIGKLVSKGHTESLKFFQETKPQIEWGVMLMIGIILGAFLAAYTGGEITAQWIPPLWEERFGPSHALRLGVAFIGGAVMAFGARLAGGCTSGHGISGTLQLSVGSWIALLCFFAGGGITANLMFRI
ncbi:MAG: YeeE/YedE thiosulfate transporter family protein [Nitrosospira sp.]